MARIAFLAAVFLSACTTTAPKPDIESAFRTGSVAAPPLPITIVDEGVSLPPR